MIDWVLGLLGTVLYPLFSVIFVFIDGIQRLFFAFAGIGSLTYDGSPISGTNSGGERDSGLIYFLFQTPTVRNMLFSIMFLALFLVIIFTVMAFIKNMYAAKQKGWKEIIGNAIKGLANFVFIPICCLLGAWLGNILLQAINGATASGGSTQMDRKLFICCALNANVFRNDDADVSDERIKELQEWADGRRYLNSDETFKGSSIQLGQDAEYYALIVDDIFANTKTDMYSYWSVGSWYSLWEINYLVLIVGGVFMLYVLCALAFAMVRRMFILVILFVISPGVCAMYPLDEGKAVGQWKDKFIKEFLSVYGSIAGINIFFALLPLVDKIGMEQIMGGASNVVNAIFMNGILQLFILVSGLFCVKEVTGLISGLIGANDAYGNASSMMKQTAGKIGKTAVGTAGVFAIAAATKKGGGSFMGSLAGQARDATLKTAGIDTKAFGEKTKNAREHALDSRKSRSDRRKQKEAEDAADAAAGITPETYEPVSGHGFKGGLGAMTRNAGHWIGTQAKKAGRTVGEGMGVQKKKINYLDDEAFEQMLKQTEGLDNKDDVVKELFRRRAEQKNYEEDHAVQRSRNAEKGSRWKAFRKGSDAKVATVESEQEAWKKKKEDAPARQEALETETQRVADSAYRATSARDAATEAESKLDRKADGTVDTEKISAARLEVLRIQAQATDIDGNFTAEAITAQEELETALDKNARIDDYTEKTEKAENAEENAKVAAEALKTKLEEAAESFKGGMKSAAQGLASELNRVLETNTLDTDIVKKLEAAFKNFTTKSVSSGSDRERKELIEIMKEIREALHDL